MRIFDRIKNIRTRTKPNQADSQDKDVKETKKVENKPTVLLSDAGDVIVRPLVTEKTAVLGSNNTYVFIVRKDANKISVRNAVKKMYGVTPINVNIMNVSGKQVRRGRVIGSRSDWKKAIVTLAKGHSINVHEGV